MQHRTILAAASSLTLLASGCSASTDDCDLTLTCPSYANAGSTTPDGGTKPDGAAPGCDRKPSEEGFSPEDRCGVFAAPAAMSGGDGSMAAPFTSLQAAIDAAAASGKVVYACADVFEEAIRLPSGMALYGGLDCSAGWAYTPMKRAIVAPLASAAEGGSEIGAILSPGEGTTVIEDVDILAPSGQAPSASSIGLLVADTQAEIARSAITAGDGKSGAPAEHMADAPSLAGVDGDVGYNICGATNENPGPKGPMKVCGASTSHGGDGGDGGPPPDDPGGDGAPGTPVDPLLATSGLGGAGQSVNACTPGGQGQGGQKGLPGEGGSGVGSLSLDGFTGAPGASGARGAPGQGGGGGGGSKGKALVACVGQATLARAGATGGSGATGGCGGEGGRGGQWGGSSIAFATLSTKVVELHDVTLHVGAGGDGGQGAVGQNGGNGGFGKSGGQGSNGTSNGCPGGDGGHGGAGGPGGGGLGGHAIGVAYTGLAPKGAPMVSYAGSTPKPGKGGAPGAGSVLPAGQGTNGLSGDLVSLAAP